MNECDRLAAVKDESQVIGEFLDWLSVQGIALAKPDEETASLPPCWFLPIQEGPEDLLARFFEIDLIKLDDEKRAILAADAAGRME